MVKLLLSLVLLPTLALGQFSSPGIMQPVVAESGGGSQVDVLAKVTFETSQSFSDASGGNVDIQSGAQQGWTTINTGSYYITDDFAQAGTQSLYSVVDASGSTLYKTFTAQTGTFWVDFYWRGVDTSGASSRFTVADTNVGTAGNQSMYLGLNGGNIQYYNGSTWVTIVAAANDTWYRIQAELNVATDTMNIWVDGTQYVTGGSFRAAQTQLNTIGFNESGSTAGDNSYVDNVWIYTGDRAP